MELSPDLPSDRSADRSSDRSSGLSPDLPSDLSPLAYLAEVRRIADHIERTQLPAVAEAGALIAASIAADGVLQSFGTGHSEALAMELSGRAGGLVPSNKLALRDLILHGGDALDSLADPKIERVVGLSRRVYAL